MNLTGRASVITGASKGLGKAMALALGAAGARLALVSRDPAKLADVAKAAGDLGAEAAVFQADVSREESVLQLERDVAARFGRVDILVNNAGTVVRKPCVNLTLADWNYVMDTNLTSTFLMCRSFVPHMKGRGYGRVINISSIMGHVALPERTAYAASKAGMLGFTRALALELASEQITVIAVSPGFFLTEMTAPLAANPESNALMNSRIPLGRWGKPEEIGKLALYLCSDEAAFITGTDIVIDGGWCAQ